MRDVEFRDGKRAVPDHVADFLDSLETYSMTYREAMDRANKRMLAERLDKAQRNALSEHFKRFPK